MNGNGNGVVFWRWVSAVLASVLVGLFAYSGAHMSSEIKEIDMKLINVQATGQAQALQIQSNLQRFDEIIRRLERIEKKLGE